MPIYDRPTKSLMVDWAKENLSHGEIFRRSAPVQWFANRYPKIKSNTVNMHVESMAVNNPVRKHHPSVKAGNGYDLFFKVGQDQFRLWDSATDPAPNYFKENPLGDEPDEPDDPTCGSGPPIETGGEAAREFAYERDLRNYLVKNLTLIEPGLRLYDVEGITGVEFPVGGRFIDLLAIDRDDCFVVIELKVSRGYDRVVGQLLRYMGWVEKELEASQPVR